MSAVPDPRPAPPLHPQLRALLDAPRAELEARLLDGDPVLADDLADTLFRGTSLGLPDWVESLSWKSFCKTIHLDENLDEEPVLRGWNVRLEQTGLEGDVVFQTRRGPDGSPQPLSFGHYRVEGGRDGTPLLLNYGTGGNALLDPTRLVRDPLVSLTGGSTELLLGWSFLQLGPWRVGTPSYFALQPVGPLRHVAHPPRSPG